MVNGMRTALYDAKYQALLVNRNEEADDSVTIAGKLCESGDVLLKDAKLPHSRNVRVILLCCKLVVFITLWHPITIKCKSLLCLKDGKAR